MAKPPVSNDDSNKPSFLKALEAVVAAGRLGLLGPAARAAMEAMPDLDAECRDGKVGQETPSSIPLLGEEEEAKEGEKEEEKEAKKGNEEEKKTPSSISLLGEEEEGEKEEEKEAKKGNEEEKARKEERKNKGKIANKEGNTDVAVTPLVKGWCRARKDIWICGDRVISLSTMRSQFSRHGLQLGYPATTALVAWRGIPTMMWDDLLPNLHQLYHQHRFPSIVVIHLGENDLLVDSSSSLVTRMQSDLVILQKAFRNIVIIWSSLLPKGIWKTSEKSQVMESERNKVNCKMEEFCNESCMYYFSHPLLTPENKFLFTHEDTLSNKGADVFITELRKVLHTYLDHN